MPAMSFLVVLAALVFLMLVAYRGFSVIIFAPIAALLAVLLTDPAGVLPVYSGLFMDKMVVFVKLYFPVFLLGAVFGKVIELSGFSKSIVAAIIRLVGAQRAVLAIVLVCNMLTYGGVSLFVVVFAVYPFAAEVFRQGNIPKRLIPGAIALGAFSYTMDALPGTPQIQNIIPTTFFKTDAYAAPWLGVIGAVFIFAVRHDLPDLADAPGGRRPARATAPATSTSPSTCRRKAWPIRSSPSCRWSRSACSTRCSPSRIPRIYGATRRDQPARAGAPDRHRGAADRRHLGA